MKFEFYLPTREECQELVKNSEVFYCIKKIIDSVEVELYDYRLASFGDFVNNKAFELRGLCFVNNNGTWERNILLNKFFNLNESSINYYKLKKLSNDELVFDGPETDRFYISATPNLAKLYKKEKYVKMSWMLEDIKDKKIIRVQEKLDGSVISFIKINNKFYAKSKMSFDSEQAQLAQQIFDNSPGIQSMVKTIFSDGCTPIFELVSPFNQIVLPYNETKLKLIQIRNNKTGEYLNKDTVKSYLDLNNINHLCAEDYEINNYTFENLLELQEKEQNIEGWVITLEDGQMLKIKTSWYFAAHHLTTENITRENLLLELVLEDKLDDVLSVVQGEKKKYLEEMTEKIQHYFNHQVIEYKKLRGLYFNKFNEDRKEFATKYKNHELFGAVMKTLNTSFRDIEETAKNAVKTYMLKKYNSLTAARELLKTL